MHTYSLDYGIVYITKQGTQNKGVNSMNTAFYKINNQTKRMVDNELTQKELAKELRDNGFKVIKIFKGDVDFNTFEKWEFLNR